jgi:Uma2 family endonuclease
MSVAASTTLISVEEYLRTSYKPACDYIDGVLRQKPMPTFDHANMELVVCNLINRFDGFRAVPEQTVRIREGKYLVPDIAVQRLDELQRPYPIKPVHLCVEVMSPEDRFVDTVTKCGEYHAWGVEYCWIVDPDGQRCWQYDSGGRPNDVLADGQITAGPIILSHADIFEPF